MRYYFAALLAVMIFGAPWIALNYPNEIAAITRTLDRVVLGAASQLAAAIMHNPKTIAELQEKYAGIPDISVKSPSDVAGSTSQNIIKPSKIRILLVPGHEPDFGGTEYGLLKERDMAVELAQDLRGVLENDPHFEVFLTRDENSWSPDFATYFKNNWNAIIDWQKASHQEMKHLVAIGSSSPLVSTVVHNKAPTNVAYRLYGITKWANENDIDIVIHIHFNDYPGHKSSGPGKHSGFAIYVPATQYGNSTTTKSIAQAVFKHLAKYNPVSDLPGESGGIVDEPDLIAIGANNTSDAASMLVEYGYIYEPQFVSSKTRSLALKDLAYQTYLGLEDFFGDSAVASRARAYDTLILPYEWKNKISADGASLINPDIFALQTAFINDGVYPPKDSTLNDCPRSSKLGLCTREALADFQNKYGITGEKDSVGSKTLDTLNTKFGLGTI